MLYGRAWELAIRAALHLALQPPGKLSPVHKIAQNIDVPQPYLAKIIQQLTRAGLVRGFRGPRGGIELGRAPGAINLWSLVRAMEGPMKPPGCVLGLRGCSGKNPCPLHPRWARLRAETQRLLKQTTLGGLAHALRKTPKRSRILGSGSGKRSPAQKASERLRSSSNGLLH